MKKALIVAAWALAFTVSIVWAGAISDLRVERDRDNRQNTVFKLVNIGSKNVKAKVEHRKRCSGVTNRDAPQVTEHWLAADQSVQLAKVWRSSTCQHDFRILEAIYF